MTDEIKTRQQLMDELAAVRQQLADFEKAFQASPNPVVITRLSDGLVIYANESMANLIGYSRDEAIGKTTLQLGLYADPSDRQRLLAQLQEQGGVCGVETRLRRKLGEVRQILVSASPADMSGEPCMLTAIFDITPFKQLESVLRQSEAALRESEEKYRNLVERANDGICIIQDETVKYLNTRLVGMWGGSADDVVGQPFADFVHPDALPAVLDHYRRRMTGEAVPSIYEAAVRRKDGSRLDVELNAGLITYQGRPANLVIMRDITERKQAEEKLVEERTLLRTLIDNLPDLIYVKDTQGRYIAINEATAQFMGAKTPEQVLGKTDFEFYPAEMAGRFYEDEQQVMQSGQPMLGYEEPALKISSGEQRWVSTTQVPLRDAAGQIVGLVGIGRDITEHRQAEQELAEERRLLRTLVDIVPDLIYIKDTQDRFLLANEPLARLMGVESPQEVLGKTDFDFLPHGMAAEFYANEQQVMQSGQPLINYEEFLVDPTGRRRWHLSTKVPWCDSSGKVIGLVGVGREITERKQAEEELRQSQQRLEVALRGADLGWYDWNCQTNDVVVNDRYAEMLGYSVEELQPGLKTWEDLIHPEDRPREIEALQRELAPPFPLVETEYRMRCKNGDWRWILDRGKVVAWDAEGKPLRAAGTHLDITPRKRAEEEREQLQAELLETQKMKAIGQLTTGAAHHFNNLLTSINGFAELIRLRMSPDDPSYDMADKILVSGQRAADLVNQLLAFSSKQMVMPVLLNINDVVRQMDVMLQHIGLERVELVTNLAPDLWPVKMDLAQVRQIVVSLALNARDAMPKGGRLTIETVNVVLDDRYAADHPNAQPGPHVRLCISDTGIGMSDEVKQHLFEPFFTTAEVGKGVGLGLAAVYGIARQNKGFIRVDSQPGQGTAVTIYVPGVPETSGPGRAADVPPGSETILVLEDHEAVLELAQQVLQDEGYLVLTASSGQQALALAEQHTGPIHLLLTDVIMPGIDGREVADRLAATRPGLKVLYMSGHTGDAIRHQHVREADVAFLPKPFSPLALARKVRQMLYR